VRRKESIVLASVWLLACAAEIDNGPSGPGPEGLGTKGGSGGSGAAGGSGIGGAGAGAGAGMMGSGGGGGLGGGSGIGGGAGTGGSSGIGGSGTGGDSGAGGSAGEGGAGGSAGEGGAGGSGGSGTGASGGDAGSAGTAGTGGGGAGGGGGTGGPSCLDGIKTYGAAGPFQYQARHSGTVKIWVPTVPAGCKVPVVHLANGTGATCSAYQQVLNRLASHGFLTTCYENTNTGAGTQGITAIETVYRNHAALADTKIGSTGHSQGGQAAFTVLEKAEAKWGPSYTYAGLAMQPASGFGSQPSPGPWSAVYGRIKSPMFMFSGTADILVSAAWVQRGFDALSDTIEAYNWSAVGATHIPTPQAATNQVAVAWFRWKLLGDNEACKAFKALPGGADWNSVKEQNAKSCL
jgi:hypothetical protein